MLRDCGLEDVLRRAGTGCRGVVVRDGTANFLIEDAEFHFLILYLELILPGCTQDLEEISFGILVRTDIAV